MKATLLMKAEKCLNSSLFIKCNVYGAFNRIDMVIFQSSKESVQE